MQPTYMRSVSFWGKFTSGSRISASRSDLLKVPTIRRVEALKEESGGTMQIQFSLHFHLWLGLFSSAGCGSCFYWTSLGRMFYSNRQSVSLTLVLSSCIDPALIRRSCQHSFPKQLNRVITARSHVKSW